MLRGTNDMPIYEFNCVGCGPFTELRRVSECDMPAACPACNTTARRMISVPRLAIMERSNRTAWDRNEKSAHEPRRHQVGHHHDHAHEHQGKQTHKHQHGHSHNGRPWMLGH